MKLTFGLPRDNCHNEGERNSAQCRDNNTTRLHVEGFSTEGTKERSTERTEKTKEAILENGGPSKGEPLIVPVIEARFDYCQGPSGP
jgi:hypothetical protein